MCIIQREVRYRRRMNLRVTTREEAAQFVDDVGFCFLFPIQGLEMPSLWDAIAGRVVKTTNKHSGYEIERTWGWKDEALDKRVWFYGKLIRNKATLVSLDFLPNFYALSENFGDYEHDYLEEYKTGQLTSEAKQVYEALLKNGALDAVRLRREAHLSSDANKGRFDKALTDLQTGLKVLPVGIAAGGGVALCVHLRDFAALVSADSRSGAADQSGGGAPPTFSIAIFATLFSLPFRSLRVYSAGRWPKHSRRPRRWPRKDVCS